MASVDSGDRSSAFMAGSVPDAYEDQLVPAVFAPWAEVLLDAVDITPGSRVLDIASGTGVVARAAARRAGSGGRVVASDVSAPMLTRAAAVDPAAGAAPIVYRQAAAEALGGEDGSFDVVVCQQGLQFFPAAAAAVAEMRRVLRPGGVAAIAVWARGYPLEPFGVYGEELAALGVEPPFPGGFDADTFTMEQEAVRSLFAAADFSPLDAEVIRLEVSWADAGSAAAGVFGTPFGPTVNALSDAQRDRFEAALTQRFAPEREGDRVRRQTAAVLVRATAA